MDEIYKIIDSEDDEIFFEGTLQEAKDWWWNQLTQSSDVGGYKLVEPVQS